MVWYSEGYMTIEWLKSWVVRDALRSDHGCDGGAGKKQYRKDFDGWNKVLKRLQKRRRLPWFKVGEIWLVAWGVCSGTELDGKGENFARPALLYKKLSTRKCFVIPLTGTTKNMSGWVKYDKGCLIIEEGRSLDANRLLKKRGRMDRKNFATIQKAITTFFT